MATFNTGLQRPKLKRIALTVSYRQAYFRRSSLSVAYCERPRRIRFLFRGRVVGGVTYLIDDTVVVRPHSDSHRSSPEWVIPNERPPYFSLQLADTGHARTRPAMLYPSLPGDAHGHCVRDPSTRNALNFILLHGPKAAVIYTSLLTARACRWRSLARLPVIGTYHPAGCQQLRYSTVCIRCRVDSVMGNWLE